MKKSILLATAAAAALLMSPVLAQNADQTKKPQVQQRETTGAKTSLPRLFVGPGVTKGNDVYDCTGKYLGADPDPNIRAQILREGEPSCAAGQ